MSQITGNRKHAFNLGRLVGHLSKIQIQNETSPAYGRFSVSYLSKANFMSVANDTITKLGHYHNSGELHNYIPGGYEMQDFVGNVDEREVPTDWEISDEEVRYYYGLGIAESLTYSDPEENMTD